MSTMSAMSMLAVMAVAAGAFTHQARQATGPRTLASNPT